MKTSTIIGVGIIAMLLSLVSGFGVGWHWRGVDYLAKANNQFREAAIQYSQGVQKILDQSAVQRNKFDALNQQTATESAAIVGRMGELDDQLQSIQTRLSKLSTIGVCRFTPDADSLYADAYKATIGAAARPKSTDPR